MDVNAEKNASSLLGDLFQYVVNDMKRMMPLWEEFITKTNKLSVSLRSTVTSLSSFLDTLQKIADIATGARGATKEIGSGLTRLCLRHRNVENKLKAYNSGLLELMVNPIQEKLEDWKKTVVLLDKEHSKDQKKTKQELRKMSTDVLALQNKVRKGKPDVQIQLDEAMRDVRTKTFQWEEFEKTSVRNALVEERTRFCLFISCLKPVMDMEKSVLAELTHVEEVVDSLCMHAGDPSSLPMTSEQVIMDVQETKNNWFCQTPPLSHNSSFQSLNSGQSSQSTDSSPTQKPGNSCETQPSALHNVPFNAVLSSTSDDSGFVSHDLFGLQLQSASKSERWMLPAARQRSWTGLIHDRPTQDSLPPKPMLPSTHTGSIRVPGRKKCPDINMVDDLPFRMSSHAHSLPPTPNPYAVPSLVGRVDAEKSSLDKFFQNSGEQSTAIGTGFRRTSVDVASIDPEAITWSASSHPTFDEDDDESFRYIMEEFNQNSSPALFNFRDLKTDAKHVECIDTEELTAAMQELEWTTAMLDIMDDTELVESTARKGSVQKDESLTFPGDNDPSRNPSKPPISSSTTASVQRRSSMQGGSSNNRKPPPPIRRTSSMVGSPQQLNFPGTSSPEDPTTPNSAPLLDNHHNHRQQPPPLRVSSMTTVATSTDNMVLPPPPPPTTPKPSSASLGALPQDETTVRRGSNGRKIPRMTRTTSVPFGKTDEERPPPPPVAQRERSRLPRRSLSDTHADIIQTLTEQFSTSPPQTTTATAVVEKCYPVRLAALGMNCGKLVNTGRGGGGLKSPPLGEAPRDLGQIPEGVTIYKGVMIAPGTQRPSPVRLPKKTA